MIGILFYSVHLFGKYPIRVAITAVFVSGWLLLPSSLHAIYNIPIIPFHSKTNAISLAVLLGIIIKHPKVFENYRFHPIDIPVLCWSFVPFFSSITNDLGPYDGGGASLAKFVDYGIPYFIGRLCCGSFEGLKTLGIGMFIGALVIAPLALMEMVISPQFHILLYGWYPHDFSQTKRGLGYRPSVFMAHGLELAIYNASSALMGWQLYLRKTVERFVPLLKIPLFPSVVGLSVVLFISRSSGALALFIIALVILQISIFLKTKLPLILFLLLPLVYMDLRATGTWDGKALVDAAGSATGSTERVGSLSFRLYNESLLVQKAMLRPAFGWAGFQRSFIFDEKGHAVSVPDGMWILTLGQHGVVGLLSLSATLLLSPLIFVIRFPTRFLKDPLVAPAVAFAVCLGIFMFDDLFNAFFNPILIVAAGGLSTLAIHPNLTKDLFFKNKENGPLPPLPMTKTRVI